MKVDFDNFKVALARARATLAKDSKSIESYTWFAFRDGRVESFNGISATLTNSGLSDDLALCVPAKRILATVSTLKGEGTIDVEDGWVTVRSNAFFARIPTHSIFDFPKMMPTEFETYCQAENFTEALRVAALTAERDESRPVLYGVSLKGFYAYSTDGKRATRVKLDAPVSREATLGMSASSQFVRMGQPDLVFMSENSVGGLYKEMKTIILSRLPENTNIPFDKIDETYDATPKWLFVIPEGLCEVAQRVKALATDEESSLVLRCEDEVLTIKAESAEGTAVDRVNWPTLPPFSLKVSAEMFCSALAKLKPESIDLTDLLQGQARMIIFRGSGFEHVIALLA